MRLSRPIAAGKRRVKEMALLEWLPEEWPDGVPSLKQTASGSAPSDFYATPLRG